MRESGGCRVEPWGLPDHVQTNNVSHPGGEFWGKECPQSGPALGRDGQPLYCCLAQTLAQSFQEEDNFRLKAEVGLR